MPALHLIKHVDPNSLHTLTKRGNWADRNRGVVLVFVIVFIVVVGIISLFAYRRWMKRKAEKESYETTD
ncbi:uncharacterized protein N7469_000932 [Penicillium citrinum]|uniref:Uncharacterized protein n=2 Tax=Penicillium TaxID=5073 RepID=A0A9W9TX40_PENCI|nr:uncharacterized protein N7469_000932 [Penicillium citrinum]KAJ5242605.1 hypothetical protein N7469_000932 [Penicillium citrinum]KAJ5599891.1 hypothetical protein N7450_000958 [Penicillium hetheringtonii]KAK5806756.1 hypothetical protein VI817_001014 [Penicillium citrinum]